MAAVELYNEGDLRVWWVRNFSAPGTFVYVKSPEDAILELNRLANADLKDSTVWGNASGLEVYEAGEWVDWYNEDGENIDEYEERRADEAQ